MPDRATILYIEDDPSSRQLIQRTLTFAGYRVLVAPCGLDGIDFAKRELPDLILMDMDLPDLSGREVTTRLRGDTRFHDTPIVALTGQNQTGDRERAIAAGLTGYLNKPIDIEKLPAQVAYYLRGGKDVADEVMLRRAQADYNQEVVSRLESKIRELERSNAELRRLDKVKDAFIQLTAHELRTPLTLIYGYSRLIQESPTLNQLRAQSTEFGSFVDGLVESIERMARVINEILTMARIASGRVDLALTTLNLGDVAERAIHQYEVVARQRNLSMRFEAGQWRLAVRADAELIELALHNLLGNAIKYTPDGGLINLMCRINVSSVQISVQDSGIGIDLADQKSIFERFYTANDTQLHSTSKTAFRGGGLGLGLSITRGIIEAHGGRIWVESTGRDERKLPGSTFFIELPLQARAGTTLRPLIAESFDGSDAAAAGH
ncbi:MAG: hybrid sensor histidine kinase/response regulator [Aggregatilineales bacterium]